MKNFDANNADKGHKVTSVGVLGQIEAWQFVRVLLL
jgi:hypothetical protein